MSCGFRDCTDTGRNPPIFPLHPLGYAGWAPERLQNRYIRLWLFRHRHLAAQTLSQCGCGRPGTGSRHHAAGAALSGDERATSQTCGADPARRLDRARIVVIPTTDADVSQAASWSSAKAPLRACSRPATRVLAMTTRQRSALGGSSPSMGGRSADSGVSSGKAARR